MWKKYLLEIAKIEESFGEKLSFPASTQEITKLKKVCEEKFNTILPEQYILFLQTVNGLGFNGLDIYGVDSFLWENDHINTCSGFIETNEVWYENEWQKQFLFIGDSDISWYCLNLLTGKYEEQDKPSGTVMNTFNSFDEMLEVALKDILS